MKDSFRFVRGSARVTPFGVKSTFRDGNVSASRVSDIVGLGYNSRYKTIFELNGGESAQSPPNSFEESAKNHGHIYEKEACDYFLEKTDYYALGKIDQQYTHKITIEHLESGEKFDIVATPDLLLFDPVETEEVSLLEIKCPFKLWTQGFQPDEEDKHSLDLLKQSYYIQCQFQMAVTGTKKAFLCIYFPRRGPNTEPHAVVFRIEQDKEFQRFLLMSVLQCREDSRSGDVKIWSLFKNEKPHNTIIVVNSMRSHVSRMEI